VKPKSKKVRRKRRMKLYKRMRLQRPLKRTKLLKYLIAKHKEEKN